MNDEMKDEVMGGDMEEATPAEAPMMDDAAEAEMPAAEETGEEAA